MIGNFRLSVRRPRDKRPIRPVSRLVVDQLEGRLLLSGVTDAKYDMGGGPVAAGWTGVGRTLYSATQGYGWQSLNGIAILDRGTADPLKRDFAYGATGTFAVDVPNGTYQVTPTLGDSARVMCPVTVSIEGTEVASGLTTDVGQFLQPTYTVQVTDGQLDLT